MLSESAGFCQIALGSWDDERELESNVLRWHCLIFLLYERLLEIVCAIVQVIIWVLDYNISMDIVSEKLRLFIYHASSRLSSNPHLSYMYG